MDSEVTPYKDSYKKCRERYDGVTRKNYIERNIGSVGYDILETERMDAELKLLPP